MERKEIISNVVIRQKLRNRFFKRSYLFKTQKILFLGFPKHEKTHFIRYSDTFSLAFLQQPLQFKHQRCQAQVSPPLVRPQKG